MSHFRLQTGRCLDGRSLLSPQKECPAGKRGTDLEVSKKLPWFHTSFVINRKRKIARIATKSETQNIAHVVIGDPCGASPVLNSVGADGVSICVCSVFHPRIPSLAACRYAMSGINTPMCAKFLQTADNKGPPVGKWHPSVITIGDGR